MILDILYPPKVDPQGRVVSFGVSLPRIEPKPKRTQKDYARDHYLRNRDDIQARKRSRTEAEREAINGKRRKKRNTGKPVAVSNSANSTGLLP